MEDPTYSTVQDIKLPQSKKAPVKIVRGEFAYNAQGIEELSFREGDLITVLREEDETWCYGECNGKRGMFPRGFVK